MPRSEAQKRADARYEEKRKGTRHRGWVGVLYPESAPKDWQDKLTNEGVPALISPLHDKDVNADGQAKKEHRHVLLLWDGPTTYAAAKSVMDAIGAVMPPENPKPGEVKPWAVSVRGSARYLCHLDNPEKAQYKPEDVIQLNGACYFEEIANIGDDDAVIDEITDFIDEQGIVSFASFIRYCKQERPEWKRLAYHKYAALITRYIKSCAWEARDDLEERQRELDERERKMLEAQREKAELEAGNWAMNTVAEVVKTLTPDAKAAGAGEVDHPTCEWCGAPATGGSVGPDGSIYWCAEHEQQGRELSERMSDTDW